MAAVYVSGVLAGGPGGGCHTYDVDGDDDDDADVERNNCNICNQGSLWTSILKPGVFLSGASGGVYALITGEIFTFVMIKTFFDNLFRVLVRSGPIPVWSGPVAAGMLVLVESPSWIFIAFEL